MIAAGEPSHAAALMEAGIEPFTLLPPRTTAYSSGRGIRYVICEGMKPAATWGSTAP